MRITHEAKSLAALRKQLPAVTRNLQIAGCKRFPACRCGTNPVIKKNNFHVAATEVNLSRNCHTNVPGLAFRSRGCYAFPRARAEQGRGDFVFRVG